MDNIERDFKDYIASQIYSLRGTYACCYCKNRKGGMYDGCDHEDCDGVTMWEYGEPEEET